MGIASDIQTEDFIRCTASVRGRNPFELGISKDGKWGPIVAEIMDVLWCPAQVPVNVYYVYA